MNHQHTQKVLNNHSYVSEIKLNGAMSYVSRPPRQPQLPDYIGAEGDRANFFLKFIEKRDTTHGYSVYNLIDEAGHKYIIFSHSLTDTDDNDLQVGYCYIIRGTIKRHQANSFKKGQRTPVKENVLNRVIVFKVIGSKKAAYVRSTPLGTNKAVRSLGERAAAHVEGK